MAVAETHSETADIRYPGEIEVNQVMKNGNLVAVLMGIDQGDAYTVVTEVTRADEDGAPSVRRRPYIFSDSESAQAFISETLTSFTYLGCEIRQQ